MTSTDNFGSYPFLKGGGQAGVLMRAIDWGLSPMGSPDQWPFSLRTNLANLLHAKLPALVLWGPDFTCFYNDAFSASLVPDAPPSIGKPAREIWPENWESIGRVLESVTRTGEPVDLEDALCFLNPSGPLQQDYWTFSFSLALDDHYAPGGILVNCSQNSTSVKERQKTQLTQAEVLPFFEQSPVAIAIIDQKDLTYEMANSFYGHIVGRSPGQIVGKSLLDAVPELVQQGFDQLLKNVIATGTPFIAKEVRVDLLRNDQLETLYLDLTYQPRRESDATISGVFVVAINVTEQVRARIKVEEREAQLELLSNTVPAMIFYLDKNQRYQSYNKTFMQWFNVDETAAIGKTVLEFIGESAYQKVLPHLAVSYTGQQERFEMFAPSNMGIRRWLNITYSPHKNSKGDVIGLIVHAADITSIKQTELDLRESEARFRTLIQESPVAMLVYTGPDMVLAQSNEKMLEILGRDQTIIGQPILKSIPELIDTALLSQYSQVLATGQTHKEFASRILLMKDGQAYWGYYDYTYKALRDGQGHIQGVICTVLEVTEQVLNRQKIEESELFVRSVIDHSPVAEVVFTGPEMVISIVNQNMLAMLGRDESIIGKPFMDAVPELRTTPLSERLLHVYTTGETYYQPEERIDLLKFGQPHIAFYNYVYKALRNTAGSIYGIITTAMDVTEQVESRKKIKESEASLQAAIELAELGTWQIDLLTSNTTCSKRLQDWFGINPAQLNAESISLIHPTNYQQVKAALNNATQKGSLGHFDEECTIINAVNGYERIIHASGQTVFDPDGNAVSISGTAQDITIQKELQLVLENQVQIRTEELAAMNKKIISTNEELTGKNAELTESTALLVKSNENLRNFAFVASHDLQEPLRKIQQYGNLLEIKYGNLTGQPLDYLKRMQSAAHRMSVLISDLLDFSSIGTKQREFDSMDLNEVFDNVLTNLELVIVESGAQLQISQMPQINGDSSQLGQLFENLISNALKFSRVDAVGTRIIPKIYVKYALVRSANLPLSVKPIRAAAYYHRIDVADNGIGFEEQFLDRIFQVFQRLHSQKEYAGTGIGLAICEKVVTNHGGAITATSQPGKGATFSVYLPG